LGSGKEEAAEVVERAIHIREETVGFDLSQKDAVQLKVMMERAGAKIRIEQTARREPIAGRTPIPESVRHEVWRRDRGRCVDCGSRENLEFDHIVPWSKGGSNTARNLELRCEICNRRKAAKFSSTARLSPPPQFSSFER
jgi:hypothetical protein